MNSAVIIFSFLLYVDSYYVDYRAASKFKGRQSISSFTCPTRGNFCKDCKTLVSCSQTGATPEVVMNCVGTSQCYDEGLTPLCSSNQTSPRCSPLNNLAFRCASLGIFTDPIICNKYYYCVPATACGSGATTSRPGSTPATPTNNPINPSANYVAVPISCPANFSFNTATRYCDKPLQGNECPRTGYPFRLCRNPGELFAIQGPTYVRCIQADSSSNEMYPYQYTCASGKTFTGIHPC